MLSFKQTNNFIPSHHLLILTILKVEEHSPQFPSPYIGYLLPLRTSILLVLLNVKVPYRIIEWLGLEGTSRIIKPQARWRHHLLLRDTRMFQGVQTFLDEVIPFLKFMTELSWPWNTSLHCLQWVHYFMVSIHLWQICWTQVNFLALFQMSA